MLDSFERGSPFFYQLLSVAMQMSATERTFIIFAILKKNIKKHIDFFSVIADNSVGRFGCRIEPCG
jgi:hypothetical protein